MAGLISLRPHQIDMDPVNHPLLQGLSSVTEKELNKMAAGVAEGGCGDDLIMALRYVLRNLVGRYLHYWPDSRPFKDEMVSEGFMAFSALIPSISLDFLAGRGILKVAVRRAEDAINTFLNANRGIASPSLRSQKYRIKRGEEPIYLKSEIEVGQLEHEHPIDPGDEDVRDVLDALCRVKTLDEIDTFILDRLNWGRGYQELADDLGVGVGTIHRRKTRLYKKYLEITR